MKYLFFLYYIMGLIAVGWGIAGLVNGEGKTFTFGARGIPTPPWVRPAGPNA